MVFERLQHMARIATPFVILVVIVLSWVPGAERPHTGASGQVEHFIAYALTAAGVVVGFPRRRLAIALSLIGLAGVLEIGQIWIPGRTSQLIDFVASSGGALLGLATGHLIVNRWLGRMLRRSARPLTAR